MYKTKKPPKGGFLLFYINYQKFDKSKKSVSFYSVKNEKSASRTWKSKLTDIINKTLAKFQS